MYYLELGKRYVRRDGTVTGLLVLNDGASSGSEFPFADSEPSDDAWREDGTWDPCRGRTNMLDIVAEYVAPAVSEVVVEITEIIDESGSVLGTVTDTSNPKDRLGIKKPPLGLIPPAAELHEAQAMKNGAAKYGPYNWRGKSVRASVYVDAALRHIRAWQDGEAVAADSGVHHLGHARASLGILLDAEATGNLIDDRPPTGAAAKLIAEMTEH